MPECVSQAKWDETQYRVARWVPDRGWTESSWEQYLAAVQSNDIASDTTTAIEDSKTLQRHEVIYVHGNWMPADLVRERGLLVYRRLAQRATMPMRLTIFSWPSTKERRPLLDVMENASVAEAQGFYLAGIISKHPANRQLGLLGFSYGGRVVSAGLHLVSGGTLQGRRIPVELEPRMFSTSLVAPAIDSPSLGIRGRYGKALENVRGLVNLYNSEDPALRHYHFIATSRKAKAAGYIGLSLSGMSSKGFDTFNFQQLDCSRIIGGLHDERTYYNTVRSFTPVADNVLWIDPAVKAAQ